jgi:hypothetical protein
MADTIIKECNCEHAYQDKKYGKRLRVHNVLKDENKCRCTVCGTVKGK